MSDNKWDEKLTEKFLTLYRRHKCLWNPYSNDYKNCSVKNEAFENVVNELNVPGIWKAECLQQIEVIRERYKEEQMRIKNDLKLGNFYNSKISWYNLMSEMLCEVIKDEENFGNNSRIKNFSIDKNTVDEVNNYNRSDRFFSDECIWDKYKEEEKPYYDKKIKFVNCKDSGVRIEAENSIDVCRNEARNNFLRESVNAEEQNKRGDFSVEEKCLSVEKEENNNSNKEMSNCVKCSLEKNKKEKCCQERIEDSFDRSKPTTEKEVSEERLRDESTNCEMSKAVASGCQNSCVEQFRSEKSSKLSTGFEEDGYNVCSRFKIVIPVPANEDQNLEITGYEIRVMNHRAQSKDSGLEEDLSERCNCGSKKLLPSLGKVNFLRGQDSTRFAEGSFIKFDINYKNSNENRIRKSKEEENFESQNYIRMNKKTQTENLARDESSQNKKDEGNYSKVFLRDQESSTDDSLTTNLATRGSISLRNDIDSSVASRDKNSVRNRSIVETENVSCCAESKKSENGEEIVENESLVIGGTERFNNTRMVLNVIVKILQGDESQNSELQKTLDTMLERIDERVSIVGLKDVAKSSLRKTNRMYNPWAKNSLSESTRYQNLPKKILPSKEIENKNGIENSLRTPLVNDGVEITDSGSESPEVVYQNYYNEIPALDETPMPLLPGERIRATNGKANNELREKLVSAEKETPVIETHDDVLKIAKFSSEPILNYSINNLEGEEPIASSSRRISEESRPPNELAKEFLDIVKYTIMMDRILENSENAAGKDRLNKINK